VPLDLEAALDRLYGVERERFVPERTALARSLRAEGRRAEAARVQELRKPTAPAFLVNRLVREERENVELLIDAGRRLEAGQQALLEGGSRSAFDEAREEEQDVLAKLTRAAGRIGDRPSTTTLERLTATLRAAVRSESGRTTLARGQLSEEVDPAGLDAFAASPAPTSRRAGVKPARPVGEEQAARRASIDHARTELASARKREAELRREAREAERAVRAARKELEQAERDAARLEQEADAATAEVEAAAERLDSARSSR
jgi:hypothetical protein